MERVLPDYLTVMFTSLFSNTCDEWTVQRLSNGNAERSYESKPVFITGLLRTYSIWYTELPKTFFASLLNTTATYSTSYSEYWRKGINSRQGNEILLISTASRPVLGTTASYQVGAWGHFLMGKDTGVWRWPFLSTCDEVNSWEDIPPLPHTLSRRAAQSGARASHFNHI
jgi:hypothetical protein